MPRHARPDPLVPIGSNVRPLCGLCAAHGRTQAPDQGICASACGPLEAPSKAHAHTPRPPRPSALRYGQILAHMALATPERPWVALERSPTR